MLPIEALTPAPPLSRAITSGTVAPSIIKIEALPLEAKGLSGAVQWGVVAGRILPVGVGSGHDLEHGQKVFGVAAHGPQAQVLLEAARDGRVLVVAGHQSWTRRRGAEEQRSRPR